MPQLHGIQPHIKMEASPTKNRTQTIMVPQNQSTHFTNNRERGIIKQNEQKNHDTKDIHSGIQDEACPRGNPRGIAARGNSGGKRDQPEYASELGAGVLFSQKESKAAKRAEQKKEAALEKEKTKMLKKIDHVNLIV